MQVSWSPIASWISTAATALSTPPDRPQMTRPAPTSSRMRVICASRKPAIVQVPDAARDIAGEIAQQLRAVRGVDDLGMELHAVETTVVVGDGGERCALADADDAEAGRQPRDPVAVAHPDLLARALLPHAAKQGARFDDVEIGAAELADGRGG